MMTSEQIAAFENFRNSLSNILILAFDELYQRIICLIPVFSEEDFSPDVKTEHDMSEEDSDELPF